MYMHVFGYNTHTCTCVHIYTWVCICVHACSIWTHVSPAVCLWTLPRLQTQVTEVTGAHTCCHSLKNGQALCFLS